MLNLTKQGATAIGWDIVDHGFYPNATALSTARAGHHDPVERPDRVRTCAARSATAPSRTIVT